MRRLQLIAALLGAAILSAQAQFDGPGSTGVSASLIRLFGTNNYFTAQAEVQVLGKDNKERIGTPMNFTLAGNQIRVEVDMNRMRNREQPDALAQVKPLGMDQVVSIIQPQQKQTVIVFPKLKSFVKLDLPEAEADAFTKRVRMNRSVIKKEKMEGHPCEKQRVVITDESGNKSEATVWAATDLKSFPVCVATKETEGTVVIRFRKIQFGNAAASQFVPPPGFQEFSDLQAMMAGPVVKYMVANGTAVKSPPEKSVSIAKPTSRPATRTAAKGKR
jgi:hypothetical protein